MSQNQPAIQTVIVSSKGQITVPSGLRRHLGLKPGDQVEFYAVSRERFVATIRRPSRILDFAGDLAELDRELSKNVSPDRPTKP